VPDPYRVVIRHGPRIERHEHPTLQAALAALEVRMDELARTSRRGTVDLRYRRFEPVQQVAARGEVAGPGRLRAGVDLRGDGSAEAWTGRLRRSLLEQEPGETPYDALRRRLGPSRG